MIRKLKILKPKMPFIDLIRAINEDSDRAFRAYQEGRPYDRGSYIREVYEKHWKGWEPPR